MGGKAALRIAVDAPQRVQSLLGVTPVWAGRVPFDPETLSLFRNAARDVRLREAIIANTTGDRWPAAWSRNLAQSSTEVSLIEAVAGYFESWAFDDFASECGRLTTNVRLVVGAHDRGVTQELVTQTWLKELPNAEYSVLAECGHYPMLECPPALGVVFDSFFANIPVA
jgi:pimeloyl-ACP methyl ester carboxylesterase